MSLHTLYAIDTYKNVIFCMFSVFVYISLPKWPRSAVCPLRLRIDKYAVAISGKLWQLLYLNVFTSKWDCLTGSVALIYHINGGDHSQMRFTWPNKVSISKISCFEVLPGYTHIHFNGKSSFPRIIHWLESLITPNLGRLEWKFYPRVPPLELTL